MLLEMVGVGERHQWNGIATITTQTISESLTKRTTYLETINCSLAILKHGLYLLRTFQKLCSPMHKGVTPA